MHALLLLAIDLLSIESHSTSYVCVHALESHELFLPPPPLRISGLFRVLCSTLYPWSLTFTSADSPLRVVPDFDLRRNHAGVHGAYS